MKFNLRGAISFSRIDVLIVKLERVCFLGNAGRDMTLLQEQLQRCGGYRA